MDLFHGMIMMMGLSNYMFKYDKYHGMISWLIPMIVVVAHRDLLTPRRLALARQLRSRERMQLEKQLTESQEAVEFFVESFRKIQKSTAKNSVF